MIGARGVSVAHRRSLRLTTKPGANADVAGLRMKGIGGSRKKTSRRMRKREIGADTLTDACQVPSTFSHPATTLPSGFGIDAGESNVVL